eukprot:Colp12_sorted_trinity150504_noHs@12780
MVMFGDFSLKALISSWKEEVLGPNPFIKANEFTGSFTIEFDPNHLAGCPSAQLQKVGELCANGVATLHALGGTICYTVDRKKTDHNKYKLDVLTVATKQGELTFKEWEHPLCKIKEHEGAAGHVALTYPSGGILLTSSGHWIELAQLDTTLDNIIKSAAKQYGEAYAEQMKTELSTAPPEMQQQKMQMYASRAVQSAAPCSYTPLSRPEPQNTMSAKK